MSVKDKLPQLVQSFIDHATLYVKLCDETNADQYEESTKIENYKTGEKWEAKLTVKKIKET